MTTRKDYTAIADILRDELDYSLERNEYGEAQGIRIIAGKLCDHFEATSANFNPRRFMDAIGISRELSERDK